MTGGQLNLDMEVGIR